jgi:hypothetical protein
MSFYLLLLLSRILPYNISQLLIPLLLIVDSVRNLGVILVKHLTLSQQINDICKKASSAIRSIGRIRKFLSSDSLERLVNALVISHLGYCNGLLCGLPEKNIAKLQRVQNSAARLVTGMRRNEYISPVLKALHWLPNCSFNF